MSDRQESGPRKNKFIHAVTIGIPIRVGKTLEVCISDLSCHAILRIHNFNQHDTIPEFTPLIIYEPNILKVCPYFSIR